MVRACHMNCRSALEKAVQDGLIRVNPAVGCKLPPKKAREMQVLTREEIQRFLIQAKAEGYFELFLLELTTGLRRGELLALQWDDLNLETGELQVTKQVYRTKEDGLLISQPKTKSSIRTVSLPPPLLNILKEYKEGVNSRWMFPSPVKEDSPLDPAYIRTRLHLILEHAQCKQIRFHDLRHTFATIALGNGMDVKTLSAMLGHVSAATTLDMGSTLDTKTYLIQGDDNRKTVVLQGEGDMLLSDGESDPSHINGHAGLGTLAQRTAEALKQRGITQVDLLYDDSLFGQDRTPAGVTENNAEHRYYTAISTMAVDGGRTWTDMVKPANPDDSSQYPVLSQQPVLDAATTFAKRLADNGITVTSGPTAGAAPSGTSALASVSSAPLNEVMAFMLRHSDNTLAQLFGRLTALKRQAGNSIKTDTQAVADTLGLSNLAADDGTYSGSADVVVILGSDMANN